MRAKYLFYLLITGILILGVTIPSLADGKEPPEPGTPETSQLSLPSQSAPIASTALALPAAALSQSFVEEIEPNGTAPQATLLGGTSAVARGNIFLNGDVDYFSFSASAGDRVYAALMTSYSSNGSTDSQLYLYDTDGSTVLEFDEDDGSMGSLSSSIAGRVLPSTGTYYLRVNHFLASSQLRPYHLHLRVQSGAPTAEIEPNDSTAQVLPANGWIAGTTSSAADVDQYSLNLNAGDTVFLSLDLDPERDTVEWNGQLGLGLFNGIVLVVNDAGTTTPDSEAYFMTVKESGTYIVLVNVPSGDTTFGSYHLNVSVQPAAAQSCTTYTSTAVPVTIPDGPGSITSNLTIPGNPRIGSLKVSLDLTHTNMPDLDAVLVSPAGNLVGLFTDIGSSAFTSMNLGLDDDAGSPVGLFTAVNGMIQIPELNFALGWFGGEDAGGTWTLQLYDDLAANGGTLNGWSLTVCDPPPAPACPTGTRETTLYSSDFEADDGSFTHSGTLDEWARGTPASPPITTCASGSNCWVTDLFSTYNASSSQDLLSPAITIPPYATDAWVSWAQKSQIESATFDHASAVVQQTGGASPRTLWQWLGATQTVSVGSPTVSLNESSGWGVFTRDISDFIGQDIELNFHLDTDTSVQLAGLAVDDVTVQACLPEPAVALEKTVGTDANTCAAGDSIDVPSGTHVTYCYQVTNTGGFSLGRHTVVDSQLGTLLNDFPYTLAPGASAFFTETVAIDSTTINSATWTAYNSGPVDLVSATDTATVTVPADLALSISAPATVMVGDTFIYTIEVDNLGPAAVHNVSVTDTLPALVSFVSASPGCTETGGVVTCNIGDLALGSTSLQITVLAEAVGTATNTAAVSSDSPDPDVSNNSASAVVDITARIFKIYLPLTLR